MEGITPQDYIQRAKGQISFNMNGSRIEKLYQSGCSKLLLPKTYGEMKEAVMLNTAGGVIPSISSQPIYNHKFSLKSLYNNVISLHYHSKKVFFYITMQTFLHY